MLVAHATNGFVILEQPVQRATGGLEGLPRFRDLVKTMKATQLILYRSDSVAKYVVLAMACLEVYRTNFCMSHFAAATKKPTYLYGNHIFLKDSWLRFMLGTM